jgi:hypothetical protein
VELELVLRLASLLWRLRRATAIETDLLEIQAELLRDRRNGFEFPPESGHGAQDVVYHTLKPAIGTAPSNHAGNGPGPDCEARKADHRPDGLDSTPNDLVGTTRQLAHSFLRLANLDSGVFERLSRYEAALWRQTVQTLFALHPVKQR